MMSWGSGRGEFLSVLKADVDIQTERTFVQRAATATVDTPKHPNRLIPEESARRSMLTRKSVFTM